MINRCPNCSSSRELIKNGFRKTRYGKTQKYHCKACDKYFSDTSEPNTQYPPKVIFHTLEQYNRGHPVKKAKAMTGMKYKCSPPVSTIYSWIDKYEDTLTFLKLRQKFDLNPHKLTTTQTYNHQQVYPFKYHDLKLHLSAKDLPQLRRYISWVERSLPNKIFKKGPRASSTKVDDPLQPKEKSTIAPELAEKALLTKKRSESRHEAVERFFLINDSKTVCTELPVFLKNEETDLKDFDTPLTGHIDIIQWRFGKLYIMDYKSNLTRPEKHTSQLMWYKEALHNRTNIPKQNIVPVVFNEHGYYELE